MTGNQSQHSIMHRAGMTGIENHATVVPGLERLYQRTVKAPTVRSMVAISLVPEIRLCQDIFPLLAVIAQ
jgi:hypothetical protein